MSTGGPERWRSAAPTFKKTFGFHPTLAFCDNTGEFLAASLRRGNAGSNTAADHITVLDAELAQLPDHQRHGTPILIRADTAGCTREFLAHIRQLRDTAVSSEFSVGWSITEKERAAITTIPKAVWADAIDADGRHRDGAGLAEITRVLPARALAGYPSGTGRSADLLALKAYLRGRGVTGQKARRASSCSKPSRHMLRQDIANDQGRGSRRGLSGDRCQHSAGRGWGAELVEERRGARRRSRGGRGRCRRSSRPAPSRR